MSLEVGAGVSVEVCSIVPMVGMVVRALVATTIKILFNNYLMNSSNTIFKVI
jgi:hypothetical protein